jgi:redox-sensitive bicupin YhaK (pirin superfamily)
VIVPQARDLGGFSVRRALPAPDRSAVGPFVFLDQMGPAEFAPGSGIDVRPHPHIGIATVTYLVEGEILHRDSLGSVQAIAPGAVNWMTAGRGIVHSERTAMERRRGPHRLLGTQAWVALPARREEIAPSFTHHPADSLPTLDADGAALRVIAGDLFGLRSPVETASELFYAEARLAPNAELPFDAQQEERAVHVALGEVEIAGHTFAAGTLVVLAPKRTARIHARGAARVMLLGGAHLDGPRHLWWNFVSSRPERIAQAKEDWRAQRFGRVAGDDEHIPLPERL